MKGLLFILLLFLLLLLDCTNSHVLVKRYAHQHRRMANRRDLLNDFVAISGPGDSAVPQVRDVGAPPTNPSVSPLKIEPFTCSINISGMTPNKDPKAKSSSIAQQAAQDAKAASEAQCAAGQAAAQHIKLELAEKAFQSAQAAEAALLGKQMMVDQLERDTQEASAVIEGETQAMQTIEVNMNSAVQAAQAATQQFEALSDLVATSKNNMANIQAVAFGLQKEMEEKTQLIEAARSRLAMFQNSLSSAHEDYEKTKQAAYKAACAAVEAKKKADSNDDQRNDYRKTVNCRNSS